jgi:hypothetical protein
VTEEHYDISKVESVAPEKKKRGFAALDKDAMRKISSKGGKASHEQGTGHKFTREEAIAANVAKRNKRKGNG